MNDYKYNFAYGYIFYDKSTRHIVDFFPIPPQRERQDDMQLISYLYNLSASRDDWKWQTPSEIASAIGLLHLGNKGLHRASKAMRLLNGDELRRRGGRNVLLCPPLKSEEVANNKTPPVLRFYESRTLGEAQDKIEAHFNLEAPRNDWEWRRASDIARVVGDLDRGNLAWVRLLARAMRGFNDDQSIRRGGKDYLLCPPVKKLDS